MNATGLLTNYAQAHARVSALLREAKPWLLGGHPLIVTFRPANRTASQNALLHSWIGEIAKSIEWAGEKRDSETWKRLLVASWLRARGESIEILPALDGHGVDFVFRRTSSLTKAECSELCEFVIAWATEHGVGTGENSSLAPSDAAAI